MKYRLKQVRNLPKNRQITFYHEVFMLKDGIAETNSALTKELLIKQGFVLDCEKSSNKSVGKSAEKKTAPEKKPVSKKKK